MVFRNNKSNLHGVNTVEELEIQLIEAKKLGKAMRCSISTPIGVACKEFEKYTFHQADVENKLSDFVLLQADATRNMPQDIELLKQLQVLGLPPSSSGMARVTMFQMLVSLVLCLQMYS